MLLFSLAGVLLVGASNDLLMLFMGLELVSIPTYIMVAPQPPQPARPRGRHQIFLPGGDVRGPGPLTVSAFCMAWLVRLPYR